MRIKWFSCADRHLATLTNILETLPEKIDQIINVKIGRLEWKLGNKIDDVGLSNKAEMKALRKSLANVQKDVDDMKKDVEGNSTLRGDPPTTISTTTTKSGNKRTTTPTATKIGTKRTSKKKAGNRSK